MFTIVHYFLIRRIYGKTLKLSTSLKYAYYLGLLGICYHRNICEIAICLMCLLFGSGTEIWLTFTPRQKIDTMLLKVKYHQRNICKIYQNISICVYYLGLARRDGRLSPPDDAISGMADASRCQRRQFSIELRQCLHKNTKKTENTTLEMQKIQKKTTKISLKKMADAPLHLSKTPIFYRVATILQKNTKKDRKYNWPMPSALLKKGLRGIITALVFYAAKWMVSPYQFIPFRMFCTGLFVLY